ncbi:hypothetical protein TNCT_301361 [Trichonephila clavata]|uniref:Uncharacterized protein n=1 Tax=Trichonephila clavata TaxID=2740835 RepID=A0A8X6HT63_TRICU|nr:hypothetical protein TNCT_301361 [Trichonephila clavata]
MNLTKWKTNSNASKEETENVTSKSCWVIAARLLSVVQPHFPSAKTYPDSLIVLHWIKSSKQFVNNLVQEIKQKTSPPTWYYCPGNQNHTDKIMEIWPSVVWPLTYVLNDVNEPDPLTPSHITVGYRLTTLASHKFNANSINAELTH